MVSVADKIRRAREFDREIDGWTLRLRRPTDWEANTIFHEGKADALEVAKRFVIGWKDIKESDLLNAGGSDPVKFDPAIWAEIIEDTPAMWQPIAEAVVDAWVRHNEARENRSKN